MNNAYQMYIIDPNIVDGFDINDATYFDVRESATSSYYAENLEELLAYLVSGLNEDTISDQHYVFITDELNGIILYK
jgi:hypothetical protein